MLVADRLDLLIQTNKGYITTKEAESLGIHREYLSQYVKLGKLIRIRPGVYQSSDAWDDFMFEYQQKKAKLIYSHNTALYMNGLSDRDPLKYEVTVPTGYNTSQLKQSNIEVYTIKKELFDVGKTELETQFGNKVFVYDAERAICDMVRSRSKQDITLVLEGIKRYVRRKDRDLNKLMTCAKLFNVDKLVRTYLEVLI